MTDLRNDNSTVQKGKFVNALKKILLYAGITLVVIVLLVAAYKILQYLLVAAVMFIAWLCPKHWW